MQQKANVELGLPKDIVGLHEQPASLVAVIAVVRQAFGLKDQPADLRELFQNPLENRIAQVVR